MNLTKEEAEKLIRDVDRLVDAFVKLQGELESQTAKEAMGEVFDGLIQEGKALKALAMVEGGLV